MKRAILILGFLLIAAGNARATDTMNAGELVEWCESTKGSHKQFFCDGYMWGFLELFISYQDNDNHYYLKEGTTDQFRKTHKTCIPPSVSNVQMGKVFLKYANERPEQLHKPPYVLVNNSAVKAWPCEKNN